MSNYFPVLLANIHFNHDNWEEESNGNSKTPQKKKRVFSWLFFIAFNSFPLTYSM